MLLLDTSPRIFLDEDEPILLGLASQISQSIETCRLIEEKIGLERSLAQQANLASLGKAAATIAHEVKNPLSSMKTLAQLMREDPEVEQRYAQDLNYMIGEIDRLNSSVVQLLSFARTSPAAEGAGGSVGDARKHRAHVEPPVRRGRHPRRFRRRARPAPGALESRN